MNINKINGLLVAPFTPFDNKGEVNLSPIEDYAHLLKKNGLVGAFINGSSGEGYLLTVKERMQLAEKWLSVTSPDDFKIIAHVGATCIKVSIELAKHAQASGAYGVSVMASPFPKVGRVEELVDYCAEIAEAAPNLPFYFYHIPALNGVALPMLPFVKLAEERIPNFAGLKYTHADMYEYNQCMLYKNGKFDMLYGLDETILSALIMGGARGGISGTGNYIGNILTGIISAYHKGNIEEARSLQNYAQDVINVLVDHRGNIVAGKRIMKLMGLDLGTNRTPFRNITDEEEKVIKQKLEAINFFDKCNRM